MQRCCCWAMERVAGEVFGLSQWRALDALVAVGQDPMAAE